MSVASIVRALKVKILFCGYFSVFHLNYSGKKCICVLKRKKVITALPISNTKVCKVSLGKTTLSGRFRLCWHTHDVDDVAKQACLMMCLGRFWSWKIFTPLACHCITLPIASVCKNQFKTSKLHRSMQCNKIFLSDFATQVPNQWFFLLGV